MVDKIAFNYYFRKNACLHNGNITYRLVFRYLKVFTQAEYNFLCSSDHIAAVCNLGGRFKLEGSEAHVLEKALK